MKKGISMYSNDSASNTIRDHQAHWRLEALACALVGTVTGFGLVASAVAQQIHRDGQRARRRPYEQARAAESAHGQHGPVVHDRECVAVAVDPDVRAVRERREV